MKIIDEDHIILQPFLLFGKHCYASLANLNSV